MRRGLPLLALTAALAAASCGERRPPLPLSQREVTLRQAFAVRAAEPLRAAALFAQAGPGPSLEQARLESWLECLQRGRAVAVAWRRFLAQGPPQDLRLRALEGLGTAALAAGDLLGGTAALEEAGRGGRTSADDLLLGAADRSARRRAAERLAVTAPDHLRRLAPELEGEVLSLLTSQRWLERAASWRRAGAPEIAAAELQTRRWSAEPERQRRLELARAELAAGRATQVLSALSAPRGAAAAELALRAEALRRLAWARHPEATAQPLFRSCFEAARQAAVAGQSGDRTEALRLVLECGTEAGLLDQALDAWWRLRAAGWEDTRREWLGRRLGLALAARPAGRRAALDLAASLPEHRRCLRYWVAAAGEREGGRRELSELAAVPFADLYAVWAREELGVARPAPPGLRPLAGAQPPPASVRLLLEWGAADQATREWRRLQRARALTPVEALAAAELERAQGNRNEAIACLRAALPELGRVDMDRVPEAALRFYLPLEWQRDVLAAARASGLEPWLVAAVVRQESLFSPTAVSPRGARGLLQLLPGTARPHALALGLGPRPDLFDPAVNLRLGARELAALLRRFGAVEPALAAYNAGEGRARGWWQRYPDRRRFTEAIPFTETYIYVRRVVYLAEAYRLVYAAQWRQP